MEKEEMNIRLQHEEQTDIMYADLETPAIDADIEVVDIGRTFSFPEGQVLARVDNRNEVVLGLIIHDYRSFRRRLVWKYRIASVLSGIQFLINAVRLSMQRTHGMSGRKTVLAAS